MVDVSRATYVLLPPSESKEPGGRVRAAPGLFDDVLATARRDVLAALAPVLASAPEDFARVANVRGALLERARVATDLLVAGRAPTLPAWRRYNGVVWSHLDAASLSPAQRRRLLIPSALYGLNCGTDEVAEYRLTMKVRLGDLGPLSAFWRPHLVRALDLVGRATIVNLLPKEHAAAIGDASDLTARMVTVGFVRHDGEGVAGHDAKAAKGVVGRLVVTQGLAALDGFRWRGWRASRQGDDYQVRAPRH